MSSLTEIVRALTIFEEYGADSVEAEHDEIFVTTDRPVPMEKVRVLDTLGWYPIDDYHTWFHKYV